MPSKNQERDGERLWLETLLSVISEGVAFLDGDWKVSWASEEFARLFRYDGEIKGRGIGSLIEEWDLLAPGIRFALLEQGETRVSHSVHLIRSSGSKAPAQISVARPRKGVSAAWVMSIRETSELEELKQELEDRRKSYSFIRGYTSDLIVRTDHDLRVTWCNERAEAGFREGELLAEIINDESLANIREFLDGGDEESRSGVSLRSVPGAHSAFHLKGILRRLTDEEGKYVGLSMILADDSENQRFEMLAEKLEMTVREREVIGYLLQGYSNLNIATILGLSESGIKFHIRNVFGRAKVSSRTELMAMLIND